MKTILMLAAVAAALAGASIASAHENGGGHWEWRTQPSIGPKTTAPSRNRVWVTDGNQQIASCDCSRMKAAASGCMMDMSGKRRAPSAG